MIPTNIERFEEDELYKQFLSENCPEAYIPMKQELKAVTLNLNRLKDNYFKLINSKFIKSFCSQYPTKCHWITINFDDKKVISILPDLANIFKRKILSKRCFNNLKYYFTLEQRGEKIGDYYGYHIHLLSQQIKKPKSHIIREFHNSLKQYVGSAQHIDCKLYKGPNFWQDKLDYLHGVKDDSDKQLKTLNDNSFRIKYNFDNIYFN